MGAGPRSSQHSHPGFLAHQRRAQLRQDEGKNTGRSPSAFSGLSSSRIRLDDAIVFRSLTKPELVEILDPGSFQGDRAPQRQTDVHLVLQTKPDQGVSWWKRLTTRQQTMARVRCAAPWNEFPRRSAGGRNSQGVLCTPTNRSRVTVQVTASSPSPSRPLRRHPRPRPSPS